MISKRSNGTSSTSRIKLLRSFLPRAPTCIGFAMLGTVKAVGPLAKALSAVFASTSPEALATIAADDTNGATGVGPGAIRVPELPEVARGVSSTHNRRAKANAAADDTLAWACQPEHVGYERDLRKHPENASSIKTPIPSAAPSPAPSPTPTEVPTKQPSESPTPAISSEMQEFILERPRIIEQIYNDTAEIIRKHAGKSVSELFGLSWVSANNYVKARGADDVRALRGRCFSRERYTWYGREKSRTVEKDCTPYDERIKNVKNPRWWRTVGDVLFIQFGGCETVYSIAESIRPDLIPIIDAVNETRLREDCDDGFEKSVLEIVQEEQAGTPDTVPTLYYKYYDTETETEKMEKVEWNYKQCSDFFYWSYHTHDDKACIDVTEPGNRRMMLDPKKWLQAEELIQELKKEAQRQRIQRSNVKKAREGPGGTRQNGVNRRQK